MDAPSLEVFKARLDGALGSLVKLNVEIGGLACGVCVGGNWRFMILEVSSNPGHSVIL